MRHTTYYLQADKKIRGAKDDDVVYSDDLK